MNFEKYLMARNQTISTYDAAVRVVDTLRESGYQALFAGGCVRDTLLGRQPKDYDVVTDAVPEQVCRLFRHTRKVGAQFGVVLVRQGRHWIETATFRSDDAYQDGRHPESVRFSNPVEDAKRRDFTVNGMFMDPLTNEVIDLVSGRDDLNGRVVRCIGDASVRFAEDHLRMLRAVRFAVQLGFEIDPGTADAIRRHAGSITGISAERIHDELEKILACNARARGLTLLHEVALLQHVVPELGIIAHTEIQSNDGACRPALVWTHDISANLDERASVEAAMAVLCVLSAYREQGAPANSPRVFPVVGTRTANACARHALQMCRRLKCSNMRRDHVAWLLQYRPLCNYGSSLPVHTIKRLMADDRFDDLLYLQSAVVRAGLDPDEPFEQFRHVVAGIDASQVAPQPFVDGQDLIDMGIPAGPAYKRILEKVYDAQLDGEVGERAGALRLAETLSQQPDVQ